MELREITFDGNSGRHDAPFKIFDALHYRMEFVERYLVIMSEENEHETLPSKFDVSLILFPLTFENIALDKLRSSLTTLRSNTGGPLHISLPCKL